MKTMTPLLRRLCSLFLLLILIPFCSHGQSRSTKYGNVFYSLIGDVDQPMRNVVDIGFSAGAYSASLVPHSGSTAPFTSCYMLSVRYHFSNRFAADLIAGISSVKGKDNDTSTNPERSYNYDTKAFHVAAGLSGMYFTTKYFQCYGGIQVGIAPYKETASYLDGSREVRQGTVFSGQLTLLGLRFGRKLGVFAEAGIGCKGIINIGISLQPNLISAW